MKMEKENKPKDERFICITCKRKEMCDHYKDNKDYMENFVKENPNNEIRCARYIK